MMMLRVNERIRSATQRITISPIIAQSLTHSRWYIHVLVNKYDTRKATFRNGSLPRNTASQTMLPTVFLRIFHPPGRTYVHPCQVGYPRQRRRRKDNIYPADVCEALNSCVLHVDGNWCSLMIAAPTPSKYHLYILTLWVGESIHSSR